MTPLAATLAIDREMFRSGGLILGTSPKLCDKIAGGLVREGGLFVGHYGITVAALE